MHYVGIQKLNNNMNVKVSRCVVQFKSVMFSQPAQPAIGLIFFLWVTSML